MDMAASDRALTIHGDGLQTRDFIYVSDVVEAYVRAAGLGKGQKPLPNGIYNVGTGTAISIRKLADVVNRLSKNDQPLAFEKSRPGDIRHSVGSINLLKKASKWLPEVRLEEGLSRMLQVPQVDRSSRSLQ
jgi:UDP-glucose 4-epimerase